jgi:hypothetical protein
LHAQVRDNVLLVHIHTVRIAVFANYCILFNHQTKAAQRFLHLLSSRLALCAGARMLQASKVGSLACVFRPVVWKNIFRSFLSPPWGTKVTRSDQRFANRPKSICFMDVPRLRS